MKILASLLIMLVPAAIVGGTIWAILGWSLIGWAKWAVGFGGLLLSTLASFPLYWFLWRRPLAEDLDEDDEHSTH
ncbi:hypothetical protein [Levilactobacillus zymae]|uniref:hypothetical protein n=1 Tax=Levilactobacillus zymae TaxID=267363 RepID=UPI0028B7F98A|nr:hypothetical protein [Levilactobacillus zymae]MDT6980288.1 hypothetical protein [Levilactobacillus zymae]